jgi:hypothetical protein
MHAVMLNNQSLESQLIKQILFKVRDICGQENRQKFRVSPTEWRVSVLPCKRLLPNYFNFFLLIEVKDSAKLNQIRKLDSTM